MCFKWCQQPFCPRPSSRSGLLARLPDPPSRPPAHCCLWRKCHPGPYYCSWAGAASATQPGPESSARSCCSEKQTDLLTVCAKHIPLKSVCKITNKGKSFHDSPLSEGGLKKRLDDPCASVFRYVSILLHVVRRVGPKRCQE